MVRNHTRSRYDDYVMRTVGDSLWSRAWDISFEMGLNFKSLKVKPCLSPNILPHGICYSHYGNGVRNGAVSIAQWGLLSDCYKVNPIGQWGNIRVIVMGFVDTLGHCLMLTLMVETVLFQISLSPKQMRRLLVKLVCNRQSVWSGRSG